VTENEMQPQKGIPNLPMYAVSISWANGSRACAISAGMQGQWVTHQHFQDEELTCWRKTRPCHRSKYSWRKHTKRWRQGYMY